MPQFHPILPIVLPCAADCKVGNALENLKRSELRLFGMAIFIAQKRDDVLTAILDARLMFAGMHLAERSNCHQPANFSLRGRSLISRALFPLHPLWA